MLKFEIINSSPNTPECPNAMGDLQVLSGHSQACTWNHSLFSPQLLGSWKSFGFHGFVVRKVGEEEGFVLVCEVPAIPGHADLS